MGRMELLILAVAIITFSVFSAHLSKYQIRMTKNNIEREYLSTARSIVNSIFEKAQTLAFDHNTDTNKIFSTSKLTHDLGCEVDDDPETTEINFKDGINDLDDLDYYKHLEDTLCIDYDKNGRNYTKGYFRYKVDCDVEYVKRDSDSARWKDSKGDRTFHKRLRIEVIGMEGYINRPVVFERVISYYPVATN